MLADYIARTRDPAYTQDAVETQRTVLQAIDDYQASRVESGRAPTEPTIPNLFDNMSHALAEHAEVEEPMVSIPAHYAQNILSAAALLEGTGSIIDKREAEVLRALGDRMNKAANEQLR